MKNSTLQICNETINPGEFVSLALPLPELFTCAPLYMPIKVIQGKEPGPCLLVIAGMHGNQLNGTEIVNRLLAIRNLKHLKGTLIAIPVCNVYGLIARTSHGPGGMALDHCFPGSKTGAHTARVAHLFATEILSHADIVLDLRTGFVNYSTLPRVSIDIEDEETKTLAEVFNSPVICPLIDESTSLHTFTKQQGKRFLQYEAGEALRFDEHAIKMGLRGVLNIMRHVGMLPEKSGKKDSPLKSFYTEKDIWVRASSSGISHSHYKLGEYVKKGKVLCHIKDPFSKAENIPITCPEEAVIVGKNNLPLVHEGEALFQLAIFATMTKPFVELEEWQQTTEEV